MREPIAGRKENLECGTPQVSRSFPLGVSQMVFRGIFGVGRGEATSSGLKLQSHFRKPNFSLGSWRKLPATRQEANVKKGEE